MSRKENDGDAIKKEKKKIFTREKDVH